MGKIWDAAIREDGKVLNFSGLPRRCVPLAGERLRPLGHVSADPFRGAWPEKQGEKGAILITHVIFYKFNMFNNIALEA